MQTSNAIFTLSLKETRHIMNSSRAHLSCSSCAWTYSVGVLESINTGCIEDRSKIDRRWSLRPTKPSLWSDFGSFVSSKIGESPWNRFRASGSGSIAASRRRFSSLRRRFSSTVQRFCRNSGFAVIANSDIFEPKWLFQSFYPSIF